MCCEDNHGVFLFVPGPPSVQDLKRQFFVGQNFNPRKSFFYGGSSNMHDKLLIVYLLFVFVTARSWFE
jgi:hypothetical protein